MPQETSQQPFTKDKPRSTDDKKLVAEVLGADAAEEMAELIGKDKGDAIIPETTPALEMTNTEATKTRVLETTTVTPEQRKKEYLKWAFDHSLSEMWINDCFQFNDDGSVEFLYHFQYDKNKRLYNIDVLPDSLKKFRFGLDLQECGWNKAIYSRLRGMEIGRNLEIDEADIDKIPDGILIVGKLVLIMSSIKSPTKEQGIKNKLSKFGYNNIGFLYEK